MQTTKPPLTPQMQDALQRGDIRALMHVLRASGGTVDMQSARRAMAQLRTQAQQAQQAQAGPLPSVRERLQAATGALEQAKPHTTLRAIRQHRPPTVEMGERPGEMRGLLIVAALLALAVWLAFGGP